MQISLLPCENVTAPSGKAQNRFRSSRRRYKSFVSDYKEQRLDDSLQQNSEQTPDGAAPQKKGKAERRKYMRAYLRWLWPYRYPVAMLFVLAVTAAGADLAEPLFMRYIVDKVLLNNALDFAARLLRVNLAGTLFLILVIGSNILGATREYRQRLVNTRIMLSLRRALFERLINLPLPKLWDMKTGGILSRLTGDVDTTTGLLQLAIVSPAVSIVRLLIAVIVLLTINWRLALTAMLIIPAAMLTSFVAARRIRPIYRSLRKDAEQVDGRVGETFSGIRVVRAFGRELLELRDYMTGRHTILRKEMFAHRRELWLWTSWGLLVSGVGAVIVWYGGKLN